MKENGNTMQIIKIVTGVGITIGVSAIVGNAIRYTTPVAGLSTLKKACVGLGSVVLGGLASDASVEYANKEIDKITEFVKSVSSSIEITTEVTHESETEVTT